MERLDDYYNNFYSQLAKIDAVGNDFGKIKDFVPKLTPGARVLDIGCGYGTVSHELLRQGYAVFGMEINKDALAVLKQKGFQTIEHDITKPFQLGEVFDLVLLLDVLEHVFDPLSLLNEAVKVLSKQGTIIVSVPLYFDLVDRLRILVTGSIISYDNRVYGPKLYKRFKSYNYDHVRFFRPKDVVEMCKILNLKIVAIRYVPCALHKPALKYLLRIISNRYSVKLFPGLLAHSMVVEIKNSL